MNELEFWGERVFMSPNNSVLVVGIPLYKKHFHTTGRYEINISVMDTGDPVGYLMDIGFENMQFISSEWAHKNLIDLGVL